MIKKQLKQSKHGSTGQIMEVSSGRNGCAFSIFFELHDLYDILVGLVR
jgi:hypothetical protein